MATTSRFEHSAGVIPFFRAADRPTLYLTIHSARVRSPHARWEFPKGGIEPGEGPVEAAAREFAEETGIVAWAFHGPFRRDLSYTYLRDGRRRVKAVTYFLAEVFDRSGMVRSLEHSEDDSGRWYRWGTFEETLRLLGHKKIRDILAEAHTRLCPGRIDASIRTRGGSDRPAVPAGPPGHPSRREGGAWWDPVGVAAPLSPGPSCGGVRPDGRA